MGACLRERNSSITPPFFSPNLKLFLSTAGVVRKQKPPQPLDPSFLIHGAAGARGGKVSLSSTVPPSSKLPLTSPPESRPSLPWNYPFFLRLQSESLQTHYLYHPRPSCLIDRVDGLKQDGAPFVSWQRLYLSRMDRRIKCCFTVACWGHGSFPDLTLKLFTRLHKI